jgi:hypothetical protein
VDSSQADEGSVQKGTGIQQPLNLQITNNKIFLAEE